MSNDRNSLILHAAALGLGLHFLQRRAEFRRELCRHHAESNLGLPAWH
jgi:hypothetical protein